MAFNSYAFLVFLPLVVLVFYTMKNTSRWMWLLAASYFFYAWWEPVYLLLLLFSTGCNYILGRWVGEQYDKSRKKHILIGTIVFNLSILVFFKYHNFFQVEFGRAMSQLGMEYTPLKITWALPLGISFYTFQTMSYVVDIYRGYLQPEKHLGKFALYVVFFPQLVAGPIERARKLLGQFSFDITFHYNTVVSGLRLMLWGFFKKVAIADKLAVHADAVFQSPDSFFGLSVWMAALFFWFQIYCDFSGYTDIAIGSARMFGVKLSQNFTNAPYFQNSFIKLWQGWHITLTSWFRDYLFFPLSSLYKPKWFWYVSLFITFLLTGLWHGANWTFVVWGGLHGAFLMTEYATSDFRKRILNRMGKAPIMGFNIGAMLLVLLLGVFTGIVFRSSSMEDAFVLIENGFQGVWFWSDVSSLYVGIFLIAVLELFHWAMQKSTFDEFIAQKPLLLRWSIYILFILAILNNFEQRQTFIYFQF